MRKQIVIPQSVLPWLQREFGAPPEMSNPLAYAAPMRNRRREPERLPETVVLASLGEARIVKHLHGRLEIVGGTTEDRAEASNWMRRFLQPRPHSGRG